MDLGMVEEGESEKNGGVKGKKKGFSRVYVEGNWEKRKV